MIIPYSEYTKDLREAIQDRMRRQYPLDTTNGNVPDQTIGTTRNGFPKSGPWIKHCPCCGQPAKDAQP